jgi:hypothetical protein
MKGIHFKKIVIEVIPQSAQRNIHSVGDYEIDEQGVLQIRVSEMPTLEESMLIAHHEFSEVCQTEHEGIREPDIQAFDLEFERNRKPGDLSEPGDDPLAPYRRQHFRAEINERNLADWLGVDWDLYDKHCDEIT